MKKNLNIAYMMSRFQCSSLRWSFIYLEFVQILLRLYFQMIWKKIEGIIVEPEQQKKLKDSQSGAEVGNEKLSGTSSYKLVDSFVFPNHHTYRLMNHLLKNCFGITFHCDSGINFLTTSLSIFQRFSECDLVLLV